MKVHSVMDGIEYLDYQEGHAILITDEVFGHKIHTMLNLNGCLTVAGWGEYSECKV
jgi:hypothetical protein